MRVFIVGGDQMVERMFTRHGGYTIAGLPENADLLCFTGGADVTPALYGDLKHATTHYNGPRDVREQKIFYMYPDHKKVGICRGSQFLNVMSGGKLWQDVDKHAIGGTHAIKYLPNTSYNYNFDYDEDRNPNQDYEEHQVTSTHHQMMKPNKATSELWGYCMRSRYRDTGIHNQRRTDPQDSPDVEIVWYKDTKSLCFQPHPEYGVKSCEDLFFRCLDRAFA